MPIFVSRFSSARTGLANFQALRTALGEARANQRASASQDQQTNQTGSSGEDQAGATRLLVTSQQADRVAQRIADQTTPSQSFQQSASGISVPEDTAAGTTSAFAPTPVATENPAFTPTPAATENPAPTPAAPVTGNAAELTIAQRIQLNQRAQQNRQNQRAQQNQQAQQNQNVADVRLAIRPALQSTVRRLDNLTRLINAQRRDQNAGAEMGGVVAQTRLTTSLKINQSAAQSSTIRTLQNIQTAFATQTVAAQETQVQPLAANGTSQDTTTLKQNLREDVATVTRGLIRDAAHQSTQNAQQIAQSLLQVQTQRAALATSVLSKSSATLTRPILQRTSILGSPASRGRHTPTISNLSPLRSALALLGTKVNILIG